LDMSSNYTNIKDIKPINYSATVQINTNHCEDRNNIEQIFFLHDKIKRKAKSILQNIFKIGKLLVEQKKIIPHGEFSNWVEDNLPFSMRTAQNYMSIFRNQDCLKNENISLLSDAYNIVKINRDPYKQNTKKDEKKYFFTICLSHEDKDLFNSVLSSAKNMFHVESNSEAIMQIMYEWGISSPIRSTKE
jgi:hypothetical protein